MARKRKIVVKNVAIQDLPATTRANVRGGLKLNTGIAQTVTGFDPPAPIRPATGFFDPPAPI
jgi:hypothetical protein